MNVFDIFSGSFDCEPIWLETANSLIEASEHMKARARTKPGRYFVYCCQTAEVVESIDTSDSGIVRAPHVA